jgi:ArsR family metal-binding transcriptional regulator
MTNFVTTFPDPRELTKAREALAALGLHYDVISPDPGYACVGSPCLVVDDAARMKLAEHRMDGFLCSGWVEDREPGRVVPAQAPPVFSEDVFGTAAVMVLVPCVADLERIRFTAHLSGDLHEAFPYLNVEMIEGCYTPRGPTFTFMDQHRMVCLHSRRIVVAKADGIVDAWRVLESIRCRVNRVWARRNTIKPSYEQRERPPALEIFKRLPRTNCKECGEPTCLAFAAKLWRSQTAAARCRPVFGGSHGHLKEALLEICRGVGVASED